MSSSRQGRACFSVDQYATCVDARRKIVVGLADRLSTALIIYRASTICHEPAQISEASAVCGRFRSLSAVEVNYSGTGLLLLEVEPEVRNANLFLPASVTVRLIVRLMSATCHARQRLLCA